jgi:hypothetical protein
MQLGYQADVVEPYSVAGVALCCPGNMGAEEARPKRATSHRRVWWARRFRPAQPPKAAFLSSKLNAPCTERSFRGARRRLTCPVAPARNCGRRGSADCCGWVASYPRSFTWHSSQLKGGSIWVWQTRQSAICGSAALVTQQDSSSPRRQARARQNPSEMHVRYDAREKV